MDQIVKELSHGGHKVGPPPKPGQELRKRNILGYVDLPGEVSEEQKALDKVKQNSKEGDAEGVLAALDHLAWEDTWFMNVGDRKGKILDDAVKAADPMLVLEIGSYIGYSAVRMGRLLKEGAHLYSLEYSERNAKIAQGMADWAGLKDKVSILTGSIQMTVQDIKEKYGVKQFDFVFIDHHKDLYLPDLKFLMEQGLLKKGTVVMADNVLWPGSPEYLKYVTESPEFKTEKHMTLAEYSKEKEDMMTVSTYQGEE